MQIDIEISKRGLPCLWERGGGGTNTGDATIIADANGLPKKAIYVKMSGHLACSNHALIPLSVGDIVIVSRHHRGDFSHEVFQITGFSLAEKTATVVQLAEFSNGEWDNPEIAEKFSAAIAAAEKKAQMYHCREAVYIKVG